MRFHNYMRTALATVAVIAVIAGAGVSMSEARVSYPGNSMHRAPVACGHLWSSLHTDADEDRCRERGWTVRERFIIDAERDRVWTSYGPCAVENGRRCYWNARLQGNRCGSGLVQLGQFGRVTDLDRINGRRASRSCGQRV